MFGIGFSEILLIAIVALVLVGPQKLPDLMRQLGRIFVQVRRVSNEMKHSFDAAIQEAEMEEFLKKTPKTLPPETAIAAHEPEKKTEEQVK